MSECFDFSSHARDGSTGCDFFAADRDLQQNSLVVEVFQTLAISAHQFFYPEFSKKNHACDVLSNFQADVSANAANKSK